MAQKPINVTQLNSYIKRVISTDPHLGSVTVTGEISNFKPHSNGHFYFTLKDEKAGVNCFLPGDVFRKLRFEIGNGIEIIVTGGINVFVPYGTYSLRIDSLMIEGAGNLAAAFDMLKAKLEKEGLFDPKYKKPIPRFPSAIAIITSTTGAAIEDMEKIITKKNNYVDIIKYPTLVQGPNAAKQIVAGIKYINANHPEVDTIIIGRGGGSAEDLWAFNEEILARAIFDSKIPIISAVGHEIDFTISDFVADVRAETPTAAAQMAVPDINALIEYVDDKKYDLDEMIHSIISKRNENLSLKDISNMSGFLSARIAASKSDIDHITMSNKAKMEMLFSRLNHQIQISKEILTAYNPKNIMDRGYAALISDKDNRLVSSIENIKTGDKLVAVLKDGKIAVTADEIIGGENGN